MKLLEWQLRIMAYHLDHGGIPTPMQLECASLACSWLEQQEPNDLNEHYYYAMYTIRGYRG